LEEFNTVDYESNMANYVNVFPDEIMPYLSLFANGVGYRERTHRLLTNEDLMRVSKKEDFRLLAITDLASYTNGSIELYQDEDDEGAEFETPFFLFNPQTCEKFRTFKEGPLDKPLILYQCVGQLPAALPKESSLMFSGKLTQHIESVLRAVRLEKTLGLEEAWKEVVPEVKNSLTTTFEGKCGPCFQYLYSFLQS